MAKCSRQQSDKSTEQTTTVEEKVCLIEALLVDLQASLEIITKSIEKSFTVLVHRPRAQTIRNQKK